MTNQVGLYEKKYPANWVVMQNRILQAFYEMTLDEKRLLLLASSVVRLIDATEKDTIEITKPMLSIVLSYHKDHAYEVWWPSGHAVRQEHTKQSDFPGEGCDF